MVSKNFLDNIKAVIFDLDGTLVDSMWVWKNIDIEYLASIGHELPSDLQNCIEGKSFYETAEYFKERFNIADTPDEIIDIWNNMAFEKYSNDVILKTDADKFLIWLKEHGYKLGVATSNSRVLAYEALKRKGIFEYFDAILTGDECGKGKPEPDVFLNTAKALGVGNTECLVFEDLPAGITAGMRAGMKTVAVDDKYSEYQWNTKIEMADYFIKDYTEIMNEISNT